MLSLAFRPSLLGPAGFPPALPSPSHPPSLRLPATVQSTSIPLDPRCTPSATPSGSPSGCCQSSLECPLPPILLRLSLIHISEPTRLGMISYAVFCLKKKNNTV